MKKLLLIMVMFIGLSTPSYAWWDSYGGFTCGYMDPLTSFLDNIFGPPCPPPVAVAPPPVPVAQPARPCMLQPQFDWWGNIINYRQIC